VFLNPLTMVTIHPTPDVSERDGDYLHTAIGVRTPGTAQNDICNVIRSFHGNCAIVCPFAIIDSLRNLRGQSNLHGLLPAHARSPSMLIPTDR
jgi:hypothetical protein